MFALCIILFQIRLLWSAVSGTGHSLISTPPLPRYVYVAPITSAALSSPFGIRRHPIAKRRLMHKGIDLSAPLGTEVRAVQAGIVIFAGRFYGYGSLVVLLHRNGFTSHYGHLSASAVRVGQSILSGEVLGRVGQSGVATGPHLHFELRHDGTPLDPELIFPGITEKAMG